MPKDLNIEHYSPQELMDIFKIGKQDTEEEVKAILQHYVQQSNSKTFNEFVKKSKTKIVDYVRSQKSERLTTSHRPLNTSVIEKYNANDHHPVIEKPNIPVAYTYNYPYPEGIINPIEKRTVTRVICLDTLFRDQYDKTSSNDVMWKLPFPLKNVMSMKLISTQLPITYYMFTKKNNTFQVSLYNMLKNSTSLYPDTTLTVTIPEGNYSAELFIKSMNNYLNNVKGGLEYLCFDLNYISGTIVLRVKNISDANSTILAYETTNQYYSPQFYFSVDFGKVLDMSTDLTAGIMMGFTKSQYTVTFQNQSISNVNDLIPVTYNGYLPAENMFGASILNYVFIDVDDFNNHYVTNTITSLRGNQQYLGNTILARMTITAGSFSTMNDDGSDHIFKQRDYFGPVTIDRLRVRVLDRNGELLDLKNNNFSLAFEFTVLYNHPS